MTDYIKEINPDIVRLNDIIEFAEHIEQYAAEDLSHIRNIHAIAYAMAVIGEAATRLSANLKEQHRDIPWREIISLRNRIIHDYARVNTERLMNIVEHEIPLLKKQVEDILKALDIK